MRGFLFVNILNGRTMAFVDYLGLVQLNSLSLQLYVEKHKYLILNQSKNI